MTVVRHQRGQGQQRFSVQASCTRAAVSLPFTFYSEIKFWGNASLWLFLWLHIGSKKTPKIRLPWKDLRIKLDWKQKQGLLPSQPEALEGEACHERWSSSQHGCQPASNPAIWGRTRGHGLRTWKSRVQPREGRRPQAWDKAAQKAFQRLSFSWVPPPATGTQGPSSTRRFLDYMKACWKTFIAWTCPIANPKQEMQDSSRTPLAPDAGKAGWYTDPCPQEIRLPIKAI